MASEYNASRQYLAIGLLAVASVLVTWFVKDPYYQVVLAMVPIWATVGLS